MNFDRICANCGLTYGSHRAVGNQCPSSSKTFITTFVDSGIAGIVKYGVERRMPGVSLVCRKKGRFLRPYEEVLSVKSNG